MVYICGAALVGGGAIVGLASLKFPDTALVQSESSIGSLGSLLSGKYGISLRSRQGATTIPGCVNLNQHIPLYQQAERLLLDNVAVCPLYQTVNHYALRPWVKGGFAEDARGLIPNDNWVTGYIAKH